MDNEQIKSNVTSGKQWIRLLFMILYAFALQVAIFLMWIIVVLQFFFALISGQDNAQLRIFGYSLSTYIYDVLKFLTYSSEEKPFPFADWPDTPAGIRRLSENFKEEAKKTAEKASAKASEYKDVMKDKAHNFAERAQDKAEDLADKAKEKGAEFRDSVKHQVDDLAKRANEKNQGIKPADTPAHTDPIIPTTTQVDSSSPPTSTVDPINPSTIDGSTNDPKIG